MHRPRPHLTLIAALLLAAPTVVAQAPTWSDAVQTLGAGAEPPGGWGFTLRSDERLLGAVVDGLARADGIDAVRIDGTPYLRSITWNAGTWTLEGPLATLIDDAGTSAISIHDHARGWITARGEEGPVHLTGIEAWIVAKDGQSATSGAARVHLDEAGTLTADGDRLTASFAGIVGLAVTRNDTPGIHGHAPRAGAWAVMTLEGPGDATADWLRVHSAPFALTQWQDGTLAFESVGTLGYGAPDLLLRIDLIGLTPHGSTLRPVVEAAGQYAIPVPASDLFENERGPFSFNATHNTLWLRLPAGLSGTVTLHHDAQAPTTAVSFLDLDPWDPQNHVPTLVATASEPSTAILRVGDDYEKRTLRHALEHRFRLIGLEPDTDHAYTLTITDLAGNTATQVGTFHAGAAVAGNRTIRANAVRHGEGSWAVRANVTDETGALVLHGVSAFLDKQAMHPVLVGDTWVVVLEGVPPGDHELVLEAMGPDGRTREVLTFTEPTHGPGPEADAPGPGAALLLATVAAAMIAARRRNGPPQP